MGGEKCCPEVWTIWLIGSPPRGRGKVHQNVAGRLYEGITPAWAGKSLLLALRVAGFWDHPRVGGEKKIN